MKYAPTSIELHQYATWFHEAQGLIWSRDHLWITFAPKLS